MSTISNPDNGSPAPSARSRRGVEDSEELRHLAQQTAGLTLQQLARRVREDDSTPNAERTRQVFGMKWLVVNCQRVEDASSAIPRNIVYQRYIRNCASERLKALNPASFGKLVRVIFPDIKTRRLGVRGSSKYHYCGIRFTNGGEQPTLTGSCWNGNLAPADGPDMNGASGGGPTVNAINAPAGTTLAIARIGGSTIPGHSQGQSPVGNFIQNSVTFVEPTDSFLTVLLPPMEGFAPQGTDQNVMQRLFQHYFEHSNALIESIRFMKLKQFYNLHVGFMAGLSDDEFRLFTDPCMADWIEGCDFATYKVILKMLSPLAFEAAPTSVLMALRQLSTTLVNTISINYSSAVGAIPAKVLAAKETPARIFCSLVDRLLRVNEAGHAAGRILLHKPDRDLMKEDWLRYVKSQQIIDRESVCNPGLVKSILDGEILDLLQDDAEKTCLDKWTEFLCRLPSRFPGVSPKVIMWQTESVISAALRDMTFNGGDSFGGWWVVKCWADELLRWNSEKNGFLEHPIAQASNTQAYSNSQASTRGSSQGSEFGDEDLGPDDSGISLNQSIIDGIDMPNSQNSTM